VLRTGNDAGTRRRREVARRLFAHRVRIARPGVCCRRLLISLILLITGLCASARQRLSGTRRTATTMTRSQRRTGLPGSRRTSRQAARASTGCAAIWRRSVLRPRTCSSSIVSPRRSVVATGSAASSLTGLLDPARAGSGLPARRFGYTAWVTIYAQEPNDYWGAGTTSQDENNSTCRWMAVGAGTISARVTMAPRLRGRVRAGAHPRSRRRSLATRRPIRGAPRSRARRRALRC